MRAYKYTSSMAVLSGQFLTHPPLISKLFFWRRCLFLRLLTSYSTANDKGLDQQAGAYLRLNGQTDL